MNTTYGTYSLGAFSAKLTRKHPVTGGCSHAAQNSSDAHEKGKWERKGNGAASLPVPRRRDPTGVRLHHFLCLGDRTEQELAGVPLYLG